jgi:hypothetical protein
MSFSDVEAGLARPASNQTAIPQSPQDAAFLGLNSSLSLQVFKINANVQGILKLVDQLGTARDTGSVRKALYVDSLKRYVNHVTDAHCKA